MKRDTIQNFIPMMLASFIALGISARYAGAQAYNLDQCRNGSSTAHASCVDAGATNLDPNSPDSQPNSTGWANGNAGQSNSHYAEGGSIAYRNRVTGLTPGTYTLRMSYGIKHGDVHALDYLTHVNRPGTTDPASPGPATIVDPCHGAAVPGVTNCQIPVDGFPATIAGANLNVDWNTFVIPSPTICASPKNDLGYLGSDGTNGSAPAADQPCTSYDDLFDNDASHNAVRMLLVGGLITNIQLVEPSNALDPDEENTDSDIVITFTAVKTNVVFAWGGHIASRLDWGFKLGNGSKLEPASASGISGSPYHMDSKGLCSGVVSNCDVGGDQDRSLSAAAVVAPASITIIKLCDATTVDTALDFPFTTTEPTSGIVPDSFNLKCDAGPTDNTATNTNIIEMSGIFAFGNYTVDENPPVGWELTSINCSDNDSNSNPTSSTATGVASFAVTEGYIATCIYTNRRLSGTLNVCKVVTNDNGGTLTAADFMLHVKSAGTDVTGSPAAGVAPTTCRAYTVNQGSYVVTEDTAPSGYQFTGYGDASGLTNACDQSGNVTVTAAQTVYCILHNNDISPTLRVNKLCNPTSDSGKFNLQIDGQTAGTGADAICQTGTTGVVPVNAGNHTVGETQGTGTNLANYSSAIGGDCGTDGTVSLALGENKVCTITNTKQAVLKVQKTCVGGTGEFTFGVSGVTLGDSTWDCAETKTVVGPTAAAANLKAYTITETVPSDWSLTAISCTAATGAIGPNDSKTATSATVTLDAGDDITCTFANTKRGQITIVKQVAIGGDTAATAPDNFAFTGSLNGFSLDDDGGADFIGIPGGGVGTGALLSSSKTFPNLLPANGISVVESAAAGWALIDIQCSTGGTGNTTTRTATINLPAGGDITCTFTNNQAIMPLIKTYNGVLPTCVDDPNSANPAVQICTTDGGGTTVPQFAFNLYVDSNTSSATAAPCGFPTATAGTCGAGTPAMPLASVLVAPSIELPGPIGIPFSICEMNPGVGVNGWKLSTLTVDLWIVGQNPSVDSPNSSTPYTLYDMDDGQGTTAICFDVRIPNDAIRFELNADNTKPGGTRTIGYWANWTSCDGKGNQLENAGGVNGGGDGFWLIDDVLGSLDIGIVNFSVYGCQKAVDLLKKSDIGNPALIGDGTSRPNDAAYSMAAQLIAAEANYVAGAVNCINAATAITRATSLLDHALINFSGTGSYLPPKGGVKLGNYDAVRNYALQLGSVLDAYNNIHNTGSCNNVPAPPSVITPLP
jgi:hypothetical protein